MRIVVGSKNQAKVQAVADIIRDYAHLTSAVVEGADVSSEISGQPKSLEETIRGARNRAKNAFNDCDFSVGIESGLMEVPYSKSGYMDVCAAIIFDGKEYHLGLSSAWEFRDPSIMEAILTSGKEMTDILLEHGLFAERSAREKGGAIGLMTKGRLERKEFTMQALRNALIHIDI
jgi:inosine/xanthosine triphosphatase